LVINLAVFVGTVYALAAVDGCSSETLYRLAIAQAVFAGMQMATCGGGLVVTVRGQGTAKR
jgi:hypothetical protein